MAIRDRLRRLEANYGSGLCKSCPHQGPMDYRELTRLVFDDGTEEFHRDTEDSEGEPAQLCGRCPYGPGGEEPPITLIEVVRTIRAGEEVT